MWFYRTCGVTIYSIECKSMVKLNNIVLETYEYDKHTKTGRWRVHRHTDGSKNVAEFSTIGAARRYAKHHAMLIGQRTRIRNTVTGETKEL